MVAKSRRFSIETRYKDIIPTKNQEKKISYSVLCNKSREKLISAGLLKEYHGYKDTKFTSEKRLKMSINQLKSWSNTNKIYLKQLSNS